MTITKEQAAQWHITANEVAGGESDYLQSFAQLAYTAGAEAKLQSLLAGVEMLEPKKYIGIDDEPNFTYFTLTQLQTAVAAAVAKKDKEYADSMAHQNNAYNQRVAERDKWRSLYVDKLEWNERIEEQNEALKAERDSYAELSGQQAENILWQASEISRLIDERDAALAKVKMLKIRLNSVYGTFKNP